MTHRFRRGERGQSLVIVLSLITLFFLLGSALAVHASVALRATRTSEGQGDDFYAADAATELGIWWQRNSKPGNPPAQTINGITTSTTITTAAGGGGSCPAGDPKPNFLTGMESGAKEVGAALMPYFTGGGFYGGEGDVTVVSSPARSGNYSLRVHPAATGGSRANVNTRDANGIAFGPDFAVRFSVRFDVLPSADASVAAVMPGGCGPCGTHNRMYLFYRAGTQTWQMGYTLAEAVGSVPAVAGTWYSFDVHTNPQANTRWGEWRLNDVAQPDVGPYADAAGGWVGSTLVLGIPSGDPTMDYTAYFDDVMVTNTVAQYPLGDTKIEGLLPNGMGTNATPVNFQHQDSTAISATTWQRLDELPMTSLTDYVKEVTAGAASYIEVAFADTTQTCIRGAAVVAGVHSASTNANVVALNAVTNGFNYTLYSGGFNDTVIRYIERPVSQNASSPGTGPWTQAIINGITARFGMGTDVNPVPYLDSLLLEVAYRPLGGGPATVTIVGTGGGSTVSAGYPDAGAGVPTLATWTTTK
jgi:hypothetical protein